MSKSGKHGAVRDALTGNWINSPAFAKRYKASQRKSRAARKARRAARP